MTYNLDFLQQQLANVQQQLANQQSISQSSTPLQNQSQIPMQVPAPVQSRQVQYVEGLAGARLYQSKLPNNSSEIIMDKNDNIFYMVSRDANGLLPKKIPIGRFTLEELEEEEPAFLTKKDLDEFKEEIKQLFMNPQSTNIATSTNSAPVT